MGKWSRRLRIPRQLPLLKYLVALYREWMATLGNLSSVDSAGRMFFCRPAGCTTTRVTRWIR